MIFPSLIDFFDKNIELTLLDLNRLNQNIKLQQLFENSVPSRKIFIYQIFFPVGNMSFLCDLNIYFLWKYKICLVLES